MRRDFSDISEVKTQAIFYSPLVFKRYEFEQHYLGHLNEYGMLEEGLGGFSPLDNWYIVGKEPITRPLKPKHPVSSYEHWVVGMKQIRDASFLQSALSTGYKMLTETGHRRRPDEGMKPIVLRFCIRWGLPKEHLNEIFRQSGQPGPYPFGSSLWNLIAELQSIAIAHNRFLSLQDGSRAQDMHIQFGSIRSACIAQLYSESLFSVESNRMVSVLRANSLIDIAKFQLGKVLSDGAYTRKCANPLCNEVIIGGRADKKTCSPACRKALERINKNSSKKGGTDHAEET